MAKYITRKDIIKRVKEHIKNGWTNKDVLVEILQGEEVKFNKSKSKSELIELVLEQRDLDYFAIAKKYSNRAFGFYNQEVEELLGINKTVREKMITANMLKVVYYRENNNHDKKVYMAFYSIVDVYKMTNAKVEKFVAVNYRGGREELDKSLNVARLRSEINRLEDKQWGLKHITYYYDKYPETKKSKTEIKKEIMEYEYLIKEKLKEIEEIKNG